MIGVCWFHSHLACYSVLWVDINFLPLFIITIPLPQVKDFIQCVSGSSSLYGLQEDTLESLILTLLPPLQHEYEGLGEPSLVDSSLDVKVYLIQELVQSLRHCAGFHIPPVRWTLNQIHCIMHRRIVLFDSHIWSVKHTCSLVSIGLPYKIRVQDSTCLSHCN